MGGKDEISAAALVSVVDPADVHTPSQLSACLDALRRRVDLSYERMESAAKRLPPRSNGQRWAPLPRSTIGEIVNGLRVPSKEKLFTFLEVCRVPAADVPRWLAAWERASTADQRRPSAAVRVREAQPRVLGVHAAIQVDGASGDLPVYVSRDVDAALRTALTDGLEQGCFVLLVGGSSVGKTRAAYQAVLAVMPEWWLVHPADPDEIRTLAAAPTTRTVLWLDELQRVLQDDSRLMAATVRRLLQAGVVVVGTIWPDEYHERSGPRRSGADDGRDDRELLRLATVVEVDDQLSASERARAESLANSDARLRLALDNRDAGFTQVLAAGPDLVRRWRQATDRYARAVITAAVDARLVGIRSVLPRAVLEDAVFGYLSPAERARAPVDWLDTALDYATETLRGAAAALLPVDDGTMGGVGGYHAADYLVQYAQDVGPATAPDSAWEAFGRHGVQLDRFRLRHHVELNGTHRQAMLMHRAAADQGDRVARAELVLLLTQHDRVADALETMRAGVCDFQRYDRTYLAQRLTAVGHVDDAIALLHEEVFHEGVYRGNPFVVVQLIEALADRGRMDEAIRTLLQLTADQQALVQDPRRPMTSPAAVVHQRFFGQATVRWLRPLHAAGFFTSPPGPQRDEREGGVFLPAWPESRYLARVAAEDPVGAIDAALSIPDTDNSRVVWDLVEVALAAPPDLAVRLAPKLTSLTPGRYGAVAADRIGKLAAGFAATDHPVPALNLIRVLLRHPPTGNRGPVHGYQYVQILRESMPAVTAGAGLPALALLTRTLDAATTNENAKSGIGLFDQSPYWRPAIEVDQHPHRNDPRSALVDAILGAAEHLVRVEAIPLEAVLEVLAGPTQLIFRRLRLHLLREYGALDPRLVGHHLTDPAMMSDPAVERELVLLIAAGHAWLNAADRRTMLALVENGPEHDVWSRLHGTALSEQPDGETIRGYADRWRRNRLDAAAPILTPKLRHTLNELTATYGQAPSWTIAPTPEFKAREHDLQVGPDLLTMSTSDLAALLHAPTPSSGPVAGHPALPAQAVQSAVEQQAVDRSAKASLFIGAAADKVEAVIDGFAAAARAGTSLDWHGLLPLLTWVNDQSEAELSRGAVENYHRRWREPRLSVLILLGLDNGHIDPERIPLTAEPAIWSIISQAGADPDPQHTDDPDWSETDPAPYTSRTVRTAALRAALVCGLRARGRDPRADLAPVMTMLDQHVDPAADRALAVRAAFGDLLSTLARLDSRWVERRLPKVLPLEPADQAVWRVTWDAHLHRQATDAAWPLLRPYYLHDIEHLDPTADTDLALERARLLANHLGNRYWFGELSLDDEDQLLQRFYDRCPPLASATILEKAGNTLLKRKIDDRQQVRLQQLWQYRVDAARQGADPQELIHFDTWALSGAFADGWTLEQLRVALELVETMSLDQPILQRLIDLAADHPHGCLNVLRQWSANRFDDFRFDRNGQLEQIISTAGAVDDAAAELARSTVDRLALHGIDLQHALVRDHTHTPPGS